MDIANLFLPLLVIILAISLVIVYQRRKKRSHIPQLRRIAQLSEAQQLNIRNKDVINGQFIGLDPIKKILLLLHLEEPTEPIKIIPLADISFCRIVQESRDIVHRGRNRTTNEKEIVSIRLILYSFRKRHEAEFLFFDSGLNESRDMPRLLQKAEFWNNKIIATGRISNFYHD